MIRAGRIADLPVITRIRTAVGENHLSVAQMTALGITHETIAADMAAGHLGCWVAIQDDDAPIGFAMADRRDGSVFALFMDEGHEGRGHGTALLSACEVWLMTQGHTRARLTTGRDTRAHGFYLRRGWRDTGETAGHFAEDAVLEKKL